MTDCGLTYDVARRAYASMVRTFEDGVLNSRRITIGRLGSLTPEQQEGRMVSMNVGRKGGVSTRTRRKFFLGDRVRYRFRMFQTWRDSHLNEKVAKVE